MIKQDFTIKARKSPGIGRIDLHEAIVQERPDLAGAQVHFPAQGRSAHTLIFEKEVFKGPRDDKQIEFFEQELHILERLRGLRLKAPQLTTVGRQAHFIGMTRVPGVELTRRRLTAMTFSDQAALAGDIAEFMIVFSRAFEAGKAGTLTQNSGYPEIDGEQVMNAVRASSVAHALGDRITDCRRYAEDFAAKLQDRRSVVMHHDLNPGNILVDPDTGRLNGIVDFGYAGAGIPELGFLALSSSYDAGFVGVVCREYSARSGQNLELRDVLLARLHIETVFFARAVAENSQEGVVALKGALSETFGSLKRLDSVYTSVPRAAVP